LRENPGFPDLQPVVDVELVGPFVDHLLDRQHVGCLRGGEFGHVPSPYNIGLSRRTLCAAIGFAKNFDPRPCVAISQHYLLVVRRTELS
jgi:hypothetical protein